MSEKSLAIIEKAIKDFNKIKLSYVNPKLNNMVDINEEYVNETVDFVEFNYHTIQASLERVRVIEKYKIPQINWQHIDEWHEDDGPAFWTKFPIEEPYYAGSPLDDNWPDYHTHFIPMSIFDHLGKYNENERLIIGEPNTVIQRFFEDMGGK